MMIQYIFFLYYSFYHDQFFNALLSYFSTYFLTIFSDTGFLPFQFEQELLSILAMCTKTSTVPQWLGNRAFSSRYDNHTLLLLGLTSHLLKRLQASGPRFSEQCQLGYRVFSKQCTLNHKNLRNGRFLLYRTSIALIKMHFVNQLVLSVD